MAVAATVQVQVQTIRTIHPDYWRADHLQGLVPDVLPYGLDRLVSHGFDVHHSSPLASRPARLLARAARAAAYRLDWAEAAVAVQAGGDVMLCWDERSGIPTSLLAGSARPVATGVIWMTDQRLAGVHVRLARTALHRASAVWALSSAQLPVLAREFGINRRRLSRLPFGVDADFWRAGVVPSEPPARPMILAVGNDRDRDHHALLRAVGPICAGHACRLVLVTAQPVAVPPSIGLRVEGLTHRDLRAEYERASIVCVALRPNLHVSGMTTVLEAQAMGCPVVCTRTPGMEDYVIDGVTGLLIAPGDDEAMRRAVEGLLADPERAREMGTAGRAFVETSASTATQAAALADLLGNIT